MKNNIIGFIVYLIITIIFAPATTILMLFVKENADRCCYYNGSWNKTDLIIGIIAIVIGIIIRYFINDYIKLIII